MLADLVKGFVQGVGGPVVTAAHVLGLLGLGLAFARQPKSVLPFGMFALALAAGLGALAVAVGATPARNVVLVCAALSGISVASAITLPPFAVGLLAAAMGLALGLDSPPETISIAVGNAMLAGTWVGACLLLAAVTTVAMRLAGTWQQIGLRVLGSWIAASAILSLALRVLR